MLNPVLHSIPVVVVSPHSRCNCRCLMCDIWKDTKSESLSMADLDQLLTDFARLSVQWVVISGGEPLMHPRVFDFCRQLRAQNIKTTILSTGLLFGRYAASIAEYVDEAIVSLDGPPSIHDSIRRVKGAFDALSAGIRAVKTCKAGFPVSGRSTVQRANHAYLSDTASAAKSLGLKSISFLAADLTSEAFNRPEGWSAERQSGISLSHEEIPELEQAINALIAEWGNTGFVLESPAKLKRIASHFKAHLGLEAPSSPVCNAPWTSVVIEADRTVRPCFFQPPVGHLSSHGLTSVLNGPVAVNFRAGLSVSENPVCQRCVCSLNWKATL